MQIAIVGGLGHIGLTLAIVLVKKGHTVDIVDKDLQAAHLLIHEKRAKFVEPDIDKYIKMYGSELTNIYVEEVPEWRLRELDAVIFATSNEDLLSMIEKTPVPKQLPILVRQTVRPYALQPLLHYGYNVAYIPERIAQGTALFELEMLPQIIGKQEECERAAEVAFELFNWTEKIMLPLEEAVFMKLMCNFYRYGTFALANQLWATAQVMNFDFNRVREAAMTNYPRMSHFPRGGWSGGFCLPKDTAYIEEWCKTLASPILDVNATIFPFLFAQQIIDAYSEGKLVGILGVSAMKDVDDMRGSLKDKIFPLLEGIDYVWHDPYDAECDTIGDVLECDVIAIGIPHSIYQPLDLSEKQLIDPWGAYGRK